MYSGSVWLQFCETKEQVGIDSFVWNQFRCDKYLLIKVAFVLFLHTEVHSYDVLFPQTSSLNEY